MNEGPLTYRLKSTGELNAGLIRLNGTPILHYRLDHCTVACSTVSSEELDVTSNLFRCDVRDLRCDSA